MRGGFWGGFALLLLGSVLIAAIAGIAYNIGVDHGTTVEVASDGSTGGEVVREWRGPWGADGDGFFFPFFPILFFLFFGFLVFTLVRWAFAPRYWGGPWGGGPRGYAWGGPPWTDDDAAREARTSGFDDWHRRSHERLESSPPPAEADSSSSGAGSSEPPSKP